MLVSRRMLRGAVASLAVTTLIAGCSSAPPQPSATVGRAIDQPLSVAVKAVPLVDQSGHTFTLGSLRGTTVFIAPFLTLCPDVCPFTTGNFAQMQASVDAAKKHGHVRLIEFSIDPDRDTVSRLASYASRNHVTWTLARSDAAGTKVMKQFFHYIAIKSPLTTSDTIDWMTGQPTTYDVDHSDGYNVIDAQSVDRFVSNASPHFHGILPAKLRAFLSKEGLNNLRKPDPRGWRPAGALEAISWVLGSEIPLAPLE